MTKNQLRLLAPAVVVTACALGSCAQGPPPVRPGSPAFYWAAAETAYRAGDYVKTNDSLTQILNSDNEYAARARIWQLVIAPGLAQGYGDLADAYESGGRYNRSDPSAFRDQVRVARAAANQLSLQSAEAFRRFLDVDKNPSVAFTFAWPPANVALPAQIAKLNKGILLKGAEADALQTAMLQRGVALAASRAAGVAPDAADAADVFKKGVPREQFLTGVAASLYEQSKLFGPKKLDLPERLKALCTLAQEALKSVPPNAKTKDLQGKLQGALKKSRMS
jgi:hypothetical protein